MEAPLRVVCWGTYDLGKPRNRILLRGLRENNVIIYQCHKDIWKGVEDKSQIKGLLSKLVFFFPSTFLLPRFDLQIFHNACP